MQVGRTLNSLHCDDSVRCVVMRTNGPGADISEFGAVRADAQHQASKTRGTLPL